MPLPLPRSHCRPPLPIALPPPRCWSNTRHIGRARWCGAGRAADGRLQQQHGRGGRGGGGSAGGRRRHPRAGAGGGGGEEWRRERVGRLERASTLPPPSDSSQVPGTCSSLPQVFGCPNVAVNLPWCVKSIPNPCLTPKAHCASISQPGYDKAWDDMSSLQRAAAVTLGWSTSESWDASECAAPCPPTAPCRHVDHSFLLFRTHVEHTGL